jgi:transcriptional regulator of acetoin/glycerol metabolism
VLLVAATNVDLEQAVGAGKFRADLLYRINTVAVTLPPLRERSDFAAIAQRLLAEVAPEASLSREAVAALAARAWPGNARELRSVLTQLTLTDPTRLIDADALGEPVPETAPAGLRGLVAERVREVHRELDGNVSETARRLGVSRNTVYRALRPSRRAGGRMLG